MWLQEEYLEAVSEQEIAKKQLDGVTQQKKQLEQEVAEAGKQVEVLTKLYDEQDTILGLSVAWFWPWYNKCTG